MLGCIKLAEMPCKVVVLTVPRQAVYPTHMERH